jgi:glycosyltransferase involved in cell wall biosynthesis
MVRTVSRLAEDTQPTVVHIHSLFPTLSPAVIRECSKRRLPVVMTLHNFRLACLPATFLRDGRICEDCLGHIPWRGVVHGCYRQSRAASAALCASLGLHGAAGTFDGVSLFLAVSDFVRRKHIESGMDSGRILVKPNFVPKGDLRDGAGREFAMVGRLSAEKGVDTALQAAGSSLALTLIGDGPERNRLSRRAGSSVRFAGTIEPDEVASALPSFRGVLVPSRCYEGQPRVILEAFSAGVPVIASRIGGLTELVEDGANGLLVEPDDVAGWRDAMERLMNDDEAVRLGRGAYETWRQRFTPEIALRHLEEAYRVAVERAGN